MLPVDPARISPAGTLPTTAITALRGRAPARTSADLAVLLRRVGSLVGLEEEVLQELAETTGTWLAGERRSSPATQRGYIGDLSWWLSWAYARGMNITDVSHVDADLYAAALRASGLAAATRSRRLAAVSSWYKYLTRTGLATRNAFGEGMERPKSARKSKTRGLSEAELDLLLAYAQLYESKRTYALLCALTATAARISSVTTTDVASVGHDSGHRTIDLTVKGGGFLRLVLPPFAAAAIDAYLAQRTTMVDGIAVGPRPDEPLFPTRTGKRIDQPYVFRLIRRVAAAADIASADYISPHSLRHSIATLLLGKGFPHQNVQALLGHADPRTTSRYDQEPDALDRSPAYELGSMLSAGIARAAETLKLAGTQPVRRNPSSHTEPAGRTALAPPEVAR